MNINTTIKINEITTNTNGEVVIIGEGLTDSYNPEIVPIELAIAPNNFTASNQLIGCLKEQGVKSYASAAGVMLDVEIKDDNEAVSFQSLQISERLLFISEYHQSALAPEYTEVADEMEAALVEQTQELEQSTGEKLKAFVTVGFNWALSRPSKILNDEEVETAFFVRNSSLPEGVLEVLPKEHPSLSKKTRAVEDALIFGVDSDEVFLGETLAQTIYASIENGRVKVSTDEDDNSIVLGAVFTHISESDKLFSATSKIEQAISKTLNLECYNVIGHTPLQGMKTDFEPTLGQTLSSAVASLEDELENNLIYLSQKLSNIVEAVKRPTNSY